MDFLGDLGQYSGHAFSCEQAKLLVYKLIGEAIDVNAYGLGRPIHIWELDQDSAKQVVDRFSRGGD